MEQQFQDDELLPVISKGLKSDFWAYLKKELETIRAELHEVLLRHSLKPDDLLVLAEYRAQFRLLNRIITSVEGEHAILVMRHEAEKAEREGQSDLIE